MNLIKVFSKDMAPIVCLVSVIGLLTIWVLPGTIALRHIFLVLGFISSLIIVADNPGILKQWNLTKLPLICIGLLFCWVGIHYLFFSMNPTLELGEIKGLWLRSLIGCVTAIGLAICLKTRTAYRKYFFAALFVVPIINMSSYFYAALLYKDLMAFGTFLIYKKIETAYFGAIAAAVAVANIWYLIFFSGNEKNKLNILFWIVGLLLVIFSSLVTNTKNGIAIDLFLLIILIGGFFWYLIKKNSLYALIVLLILGLTVTWVWSTHSKKVGGWNTVFYDVLVATDIDTHKQWQEIEGSVNPPLNAKGTPAATNTYTRAAYATVGIRLIGMYPLGYGSVNQSFGGLLTAAKIPHQHDRQVHSGWIDFGLAFGIPGLILLIGTLLSIIFISFQKISQLNLISMLLAVMLLPFGLIAEIGYKQYFESMLFFVTLAAALLIKVDLEPD